MTKQNKDDIVRLFKMGYRQKDLAKMYNVPPSVIRDILVYSGDDLLCSKEVELTEELFEQAKRLLEDISKLRQRLHTGDVVVVETYRTVTPGEFRPASRPRPTDAIVISIDNPRFCQVRLVSSGVMESVRWEDLVREVSE